MPVVVFSSHRKLLLVVAMVGTIPLMSLSLSFLCQSCHSSSHDYCSTVCVCVFFFLCVYVCEVGRINVSKVNKTLQSIVRFVTIVLKLFTRCN